MIKTIQKYFIFSFCAFAVVSCSKEENDSSTLVNKVQLNFNNTFDGEPIVLGDAHSDEATVQISAEGQAHYFSELKYVISQIRLVKTDGTVVPYHIEDLDKGAQVVDQSKSESLSFTMEDIPAGQYVQIQFGLGVPASLNTLDETRFPAFYAAAGANDTEMMWEWGSGYRFVKLEGFYGSDHQELSVHTGSTVEGEEGEYTQGVDAYREIRLDFDAPISVGNDWPIVVIEADVDHLLSGHSHSIELSSGTGADDNATPNKHSSVQMLRFVDNLGGNGSDDVQGMFSIQEVNHYSNPLTSIE